MDLDDDFERRRLGEAYLRYDAEGFAVLPGLVSTADVETLRLRLDELGRLEGEREFAGGAREPQGMLERYELSKDGIRAFWDPTLPSPADLAPGERTRRLHRLGHAIHAADPWLGDFLRDGPLAGVAAALIDGPVRPVQSLFMVKPAGSAVRFEFHHDGAYIRTEPDTLVVSWLALDDMDEANGGLRVLPESHVSPPPVRPDLSAGIGLEMPAGTAAFWPGGTLHGSRENGSGRARRALIAYFTARDARVEIEPCRPT